MKTAGRILKITLLSLFAAVFAASPAAAADPLLDMVPADSLFCVRINNLDNALAQMDQYLIGVAPFSTAMMAKMQLMGITGDPMLTGIQTDGSFAMVMLSDMTQGVLVPVTDFDTFVSSNANATAGDDGTAILAPPNPEMGKFALAKAAGGKYAIVVPESAKETLTALKSALSSPASALSGRLNRSQTQEAASAPVWAYVNLAQLYQQFGPTFTAELDKAEMQMPAEMGDMKELVGLYMKVYKGLFEQFGGDADSATVSLKPEPSTLNLDMVLQAKDGSELASMLEADPQAKKGFAYTGYLDTDNAVNGLMKINRPVIQKLYDMMFDILAEAKDDAAMSDSITKMKRITNQWVEAMGDEIAISFSYAKGQPPVVLREVVAIEDRAALEKLMGESMDLAGEFYTAIGLPMQFEYQPKVSTYKNAVIDEIKLTFPQSADADDAMGGMMNQIYGDALTYTMAHTDDTLFVVMGPDTDIKQLIDQRAGAPAAGEVKAALDAFRGTPYNEMVVSINVIKLLTGFGGMMQGMGPMLMGMQDMEGGQDMQGPMSPFNLFTGLDLQSQSSLAMGGYSDDGQCHLRLMVPKEHLMEIMAAVGQIQQKVMQQMEGMQGAPGQTPQ